MSHFSEGLEQVGRDEWRPLEAAYANGSFPTTLARELTGNGPTIVADLFLGRRRGGDSPSPPVWWRPVAWGR